MVISPVRPPLPAPPPCAKDIRTFYIKVVILLRTFALFRSAPRPRAKSAVALICPCTGKGAPLQAKKQFSNKGVESIKKKRMKIHLQAVLLCAMIYDRRHIHIRCLCARVAILLGIIISRRPRTPLFPYQTAFRKSVFPSNSLLPPFEGENQANS